MVNWFKDYRQTSAYGMRKDPFTGVLRKHTGIDLVKTNNKNILAFVPGTVTFANFAQNGTGFGGFGNVVAIRDSRGALHCYCHLALIRVKTGQTIQAGEIIGVEGATGQATGSHLHYEIRLKSSPNFGLSSDTEPRAYLNKHFAAPSPPPSPPSPPSTVYRGISIVDYLKSIRVDSSFANRKKIAAANGIVNYTGTASQNTQLLRKLRGF